ncbi:MAG: hypothetical protein ACHRHE_15555 [Tepidisphaerales bacterium]
MNRFWTCHWQFRYWRADVNSEGQAVASSGSNNFRRRGVSVGDAVYIVSLSGGQLYLGGRMIVKRIMSRSEVVRLWNNDNLFDAAEWIIDPDESGTLLHLHRRLSPALTKQLRFLSASGPKAPFFVSDTELDNQATRGVRELTAESAALLDRIIAVTDRLPRSEHILTVTDELLRGEHVEEPAEQVRTHEPIEAEQDIRRREPVSSRGFNATIDRYDRRSVARMFDRLWPDRVISRACADNLAASIRASHEAGNGSWGLTMFPDSLRLNVGQVEVLTLDSSGARFLFRAPLELGADCDFRVEGGREPIYRAVPVPSGVCFIRAAELPSLPSVVRTAHEAYIGAAASFKRMSPFKKSFSPGVLEYVELVTGQPLPRPSYLLDEGGPCRVDPLADEVDDPALIREGARYQIMVNAYERDPRARRLCIATHGTDCCICGFSFGARYGEAADGFIHVHHLRPLSEVGEEYVVDPVVDLRPVCPNCHAVLHRREPPYSIEEVRQFLEARKERNQPK